MFSPRTRRCFYLRLQIYRYGFVFSAYAEVFPLKGVICLVFGRFLRVRGGVSSTCTILKSVEAFSPRTRRCFYLKDKFG